MAHVLLFAVVAAWASTGAVSVSVGSEATARDPLRVHPTNPRYFTDDGQRAVYLTGSHTWQNLQDGGPTDPLAAFNYDEFLKFLVEQNHNFFRLWAWESDRESAWDKQRLWVRPLPYLRSGPGKALDGKPRFDLNRFDPEYFQRLHDRVKVAQERGLYVGVMLFQGFSVAKKSPRAQGNPWPGHPFHRDNNLNGIDGDPNDDGHGYEVHTLGIPAITTLQEAYVRKVIETVGEFDNVMYEISNESHGGSTAWQYRLIALIKEIERQRPKQHPVWMSFQYDGNIGAGVNRTLFDSQAEVISPNHVSDSVDAYKTDPPVAEGSKVILLDTDHLWGIGGDAVWVWKAFTRGMNPIFMDPYSKSAHEGKPRLDPKWDGIRRAMGVTRRLAERVALASMTPHGELASSGYCLANPGSEYVVYQPGDGAFTVDLSAAQGEMQTEWIHPVEGNVTRAEAVTGGMKRTLKAPFPGPAVARLSSAPTAAARPNIVFLLADDLGYGDVGCYGGSARTPAIDRLAREGVRFTHFYANGPECSPTRAAFITGRYQHRVGGLECAIGSGNVGRYDDAIRLRARNELGLPVTKNSIASLLKNSGYATALVGKWHLGYDDKFAPHHHGFDHALYCLGGGMDYFHHVEELSNSPPMLRLNGQILRREGYFTDLVADEAVRFIEENRARRFFLYVPFTAPHAPFQGPNDHQPTPLPANSPLWNQGKAPPAVYAAMIERMDAAVGRILATLDAHSLATNTLVVFSSDNGGTASARNAPLSGAKGSTMEGGIRVPCLIRWPGRLPVGVVTDQVGITMDLTASFAHAAGVNAPLDSPFDGIDLLGRVAERQPTVPRMLFWRGRRAENAWWAVRNADLKYVRRKQGAEMKEWLFDLAADVAERNNLLAARPADAQRLKRRLDQWEREVQPRR